MSLEILKMSHLIGVVFWIGPGFGAYWILLRMSRKLRGEDIRYLEKYYEQTIRAEHFFFGIVLISGIGMWSILGWDLVRLPWLRTKLYLVGGIVLVEIVDIWLAHFLFRKLIRSQKDPGDASWNRAFKIRKFFYGVTLPIMAGLVLGIFYLAVVKYIFW